MRKNLGLKLDTDLIARIDVYAREHHMTRTKLIEVAVDAYLDVTQSEIGRRKRAAKTSTPGDTQHARGPNPRVAGATAARGARPPASRMTDEVPTNFKDGKR